MDADSPRPDERAATRERIYVVGFPKSGNTWLTRLLADSLQAPVVDVVGEEYAADVNRRIDRDGAAPFEVSKIHYLPDQFLREVDASPRRIVYVYRDFRDVLISACSYFGDARLDDVEKTPLLRYLAAGPRRWRRSRRQRDRFRQFVEDFCAGRHRVQVELGPWAAHVAAWRDALPALAPAGRGWVAYRDLLADTAGVLCATLESLDVPAPAAEDLRAAIDRQSFEKTKKRLAEMPEENVPMGRDKNLRLLRKGVAGDWQRYLTPELARIVESSQGRMLRELGFVEDRNWTRAVTSFFFP